MAELSETKKELTAAAGELGKGYEAAGEARRNVGNCHDQQIRNIGFLGEIIASITASKEELDKAGKHSETSQKQIDKAAGRVGAISLNGDMVNESMQALPALVGRVAENQEIFTTDMQNYGTVADELIEGLKLLQEDVSRWCRNMGRDAQDDASDHVLFSAVVSEVSGSAYEI